MLNATVTAQSRLTTADAVPQDHPQDPDRRLDASCCRTSRGSSSARELRARSSRLNGHPGAGIAIQLAPGADALKTAELVRDADRNRAKSFPARLSTTPSPTTATAFIKLSVHEVVKTLFEAIVLVVIVMFVFLQSWRATLIPAIAVPVVLLGTFGILAVAGFSINTLTLFGLVLSIGLLVDDAIVVVENVERVMDEEPDISPARGDDPVDGRDPDRADRASRWCCRRCSCRWRSSAARSA